MSAEHTFHPQVGVDGHPGVVIVATRYLPCGCAFERRLTIAEPLPPGWAVDWARELGAAMRLVPLGHKCPQETP